MWLHVQTAPGIRTPGAPPIRDAPLPRKQQRWSRTIFLSPWFLQECVV